MKILSTVVLIFLVNLPFGYWRATQKKFSLRWFLSVHAPVPLVVAVRTLIGIGLHLATFPLMVGAYFGGQYAGSVIRRSRNVR